MPDQVSGVVSERAFKSASRRLEGREKVLGQSKYVGDFTNLDLALELDVAVVVTSSQATGSILSISSEEALASAGAKVVLTHENAPRLHKVFSPNGTEIGTILPLQSTKLHYAGECVAVVVADTLEHARTAAQLVKVSYSAPDATQAFNLVQGDNRIADANTVGPGIRVMRNRAILHTLSTLRLITSMSPSKPRHIITIRWSREASSRPGMMTAESLSTCQASSAMPMP